MIWGLYLFLIFNLMMFIIGFLHFMYVAAKSGGSNSKEGSGGPFSSTSNMLHVAILSKDMGCF